MLFRVWSSGMKYALITVSNDVPASLPIEYYVQKTIHTFTFTLSRDNHISDIEGTTLKQHYPSSPNNRPNNKLIAFTRGI